MRIVSLISSGTEILVKLGLEKSLVGISHECDYPPSIKGLPVLSKPKVNPSASSLEIHQSVLSLVKNGLSIYDVDTKQLEALKPDLIVTQDQCEVCAVSLRDVENALCSITKTETAICTLRPQRLDDIASDHRKVARFTGKAVEAEDYVTEFWIRLNGINARVGTSGYTKPRILFLEWIDPLIVAGLWMPELITLAGGTSLIVTDASHFKTVSWEEAYDSNPDIILIAPCGYPIDKTKTELLSPEFKEKLLGFSTTQNNKCYIADGNQFFNRPGPRMIESCEILAALLHPTKVPELVTKHFNLNYIQWSP